MELKSEKKYRIEYIKPGCIGCRACAKICPNFWEMENDKTEPFPKAILKDSKKVVNKEGKVLKEVFETNDKETTITSISICPVTVIKAFDNKSNRQLERL